MQCFQKEKEGKVSHLKLAASLTVVLKSKMVARYKNTFFITFLFLTLFQCIQNWI